MNKLSIIILMMYVFLFSLYIIATPFFEHDGFVVLLADLHIPYASKTVQNVLKIVTDLKPLHVFLLGDLTEMGKESEFEKLENYLKLLSDSKIPYNILLGNHDVRWAYRIWKTKNIEGGLYENFKVDIQDISFIGIDTSLYFQQFGHIGEPQIRWIKEQLEDCKKQSKTIILLSHHPFGGPSNYTDDGWKLMNLLDENVFLVFFGHLHSYQRYGGYKSTWFQSLGAAKDGWLTILSWDKNQFYIWKLAVNKDNIGHYNFELVRSISKNSKNQQYNSVKLPELPKSSQAFDELLSYKMENSILSQPVFFDNMIYVVDYSGNVICIDSNGKLVWKLKLSCPVVSNIEVYKNTILVGDLEGKIHLIDSKFGKITRIVNLNAPIFAMKVGMRSLAVGCGKKLHIIKLPNLSITNTHDLGGLVQAPAMYKDGLFFQTSWGGDITVVNEDGELILRIPTGLNYTTAGASTPQIFNELILVTNPSGTLQAFDYINGSKKWELKGLKVGYSSVGKINQLAVVSSIDGTIYILDPKVPQIRVKIPVGSPIYGSVAQKLSSDKFVVGTTSGELVVVSLSGRIEQKVKIHPSYILLNPIILDNKTFLAFTDGTLKMIKISN
ncbi:MAG: PQQ-binding-like beta-propeller repeat protein [Fervidobacterium sp.]|nr:PQQ-binding-like beta-propeller repeat protein [Fervidobacterium sp.]